MGICVDKTVNYLADMNLNTIKLPQENVRPLLLLGEYKGAKGIIGRLDQLVDTPTKPLPTITSGVASGINGSRSSKLPISLGLDIMGGIIKAMGGNLGATASYTNAKKVQFSYSNVDRHIANLVEVGDYLQSGEVRWDHLILKKYLFGAGKLYVLTEVVTSDEFSVESFDNKNTALEVKVPVIQAAVGGNVKVGYEGESTTTVKYSGGKRLAFGFAAAQFSAANQDPNDDELRLEFRPVRAGDTSFRLGVGDSQLAYQYLRMPEPFETLIEVDPNLLGE